MKTVSMVSKSQDYVVVEVVLKRRPLFHLATIYLPTICLLIIAELTLVIDKQYFEATIMVSLTSMLVMYTLYQSISDKLPQTAYLKMIDVWLLFCLIMPFFVFILLVIAQYVSRKNERRTLSTTIGNMYPVLEKRRIFHVMRKDISDMVNGKENIFFSGNNRSQMTVMVTKTLVPFATLFFILIYIMVVRGSNFCSQ